MKAITIRQPWASLIVAGYKRIETRSWPTRYRGALAIHAATYPIDRTLAELPEETVTAMRICLGELEALPRGCVIGAVQLADCQPINAALRTKLGAEELSFGDYADGRWAWITGPYPLLLGHPIPCTGQQGIWEFNAVKALENL